MDAKEATLDRIFSALSDGTRRAILMQLRTKDCTVLELASLFEMSLPAVSKHLKVLDRSGLLHRQKDGRYVVCHFEPRPLEDAAQWIAEQHKFWKQGFEALEEFLQGQEEGENA